MRKILDTTKKDWSRHGLDYTAKTAIRAEYAKKERELQAQQGLSYSGKKTLQAYLRMEQVTAEALTEGSPLGEIKRRIDGKGIVIFTLESGGTIRDTGKDIFFSANDPKAKYAAELYAEKKWGKYLIVEKNRILFQLEQKQQRTHSVLELPVTQKGISH